MAEVKWVKIVTDIFDNRKIKQIESLPEGDTIIVIWFKLLCLAGTINDNGNVYITQEIPYTDETLATQFNRPLKIIQLALHTFQSFGMIEIIDDILKVSNWEIYQNVAGMEKIREQNRLRQQKYRAGIKLLGDEKVCAYCGSKDSISVDHIIPLSKGGQNIDENKVWSCLQCNMQKTNLELCDFLNYKITQKQPLNIEKILNNEKLNKIVGFKNNRFYTLLSRDSHAIDKNKNRIDKNRIDKIIIVYEEEIGMLTPNNLEKLESYLDDLSEEMIIEAIKRASYYNKKNMAYIEGILKNWIRSGYKVLGDIEEHKTETIDWEAIKKQAEEDLNTYGF